MDITVPGAVAQLLPDGTRPPRPTRRPRSSSHLGRQQDSGQAVHLRRRPQGFESKGYDCSGTVSYMLHGGGLLDSPLDSGSFMKWGETGEGAWITVYTNPGHAYAVIAGLRLDTSAASGPARTSSSDVQEGATNAARAGARRALPARLQEAPPGRLLSRQVTLVGPNSSPTTGREVPWPACPGGSPQ